MNKLLIIPVLFLLGACPNRHANTFKSGQTFSPGGLLTHDVKLCKDTYDYTNSQTPRGFKDCVVFQQCAHCAQCLHWVYTDEPVPYKTFACEFAHQDGGN